MIRRRLFLRQRLFQWVKRVSGVKEGQIIPRHLMPVKFVLFPIRSIRWAMNEGDGYQLMHDTWKINGLEFSSEFFNAFTDDPPYWFRVKSTKHGVVTIESKPIKGAK